MYNPTISIRNYNRMNVFDAFVRIARKHGAKMPFYPMEDVACDELSSILEPELPNLNHAADRDNLVQKFNRLTGAEISLKGLPRKEMIQKCTELLELLQHLQTCPEFFRGKLIMPDLVGQPAEDTNPEHMALCIEFTFNGRYYCFTSSDRDSFESLNSCINSAEKDFRFTSGGSAMPEYERQLIVETIQADGKSISVSTIAPARSVKFDALDGFAWNICDHVGADTDMTKALEERHDAYVAAAEALWSKLIEVEPAVKTHTINFKRS